MKTYGDSIKEQRIIRGLSLLDVEKATGISNQNLCRWENNKAIPGVNFCEQLAKFYGISLDELVGLTDAPDPERGIAPTLETSSFTSEFSDIIREKNFVNIAKLYKAAPKELRAIALGYLIGLMSSNGVNTQAVLGY